MMQTMQTIDFWNHSIALNNQGVQSLLTGQLEEAVEFFREASEFNDEAAYESPVEGYGVYASQWISVSHLLEQITARSTRSAPCLAQISSSVLAIGNRLPKDSFISDMERRSKVCVTRLDWIIEFNLATALQLCAMASSNSNDSISEINDYLQESFDLYGEVAQDVLEWNNFSVTLDTAMFLMAVYGNQGAICAHLGHSKMEVLYRLRVDRIRHSCAHSIQLQSQRHQMSLFPGTDHCAPVA